MSADPRAALDRLIAALEAHYNAVTTRRSSDDPAVDDAYDVLADAYDVYDDALAGRYGEALPFELADDEEGSDEDEDGDEESTEEDLDTDSVSDIVDDELFLDDAPPPVNP